MFYFIDFLIYCYLRFVEIIVGWQKPFFVFKIISIYLVISANSQLTKRIVTFGHHIVQY